MPTGVIEWVNALGSDQPEQLIFNGDPEIAGVAGDNIKEDGVNGTEGNPDDACQAPRSGYGY